MEYYHAEPESLGSIIGKLILGVTKRKKGFEKQFKLGDFTFNDHPSPPVSFSRHYHVENRLVHGRNVFTISPKKDPTGKVVLFLHGGGYVNNMVKQHWQFVGQLVRATGCTVVVPDYPLAPEHTYTDTFSMVEAVYLDLLSGVRQEDLILMGDSAGGGLGLALAQTMKIRQAPQPARIILIAPWLDFTLTNPGIDEVEKNDLLLDRKGLLMASRAYAGDTDPTHYQLSPINGPLDGLGRISLFIGTHDLLYPDVLKLKNLLEGKGIEADYFEFPKMIHDWVVITFLDESVAALSLLKKLIRH
jgi:epsilon-lactone hydrolase